MPKNKKIKVEKVLLKEEISLQGKKIIIGSIILLVVGFIILGFANQEANNFAAIVSPFIIIFSYAGVIFGLLTNSPSSKGENK